MACECTASNDGKYYKCDYCKNAEDSSSAIMPDLEKARILLQRVVDDATANPNNLKERKWAIRAELHRAIRKFLETSGAERIKYKRRKK